MHGVNFTTKAVLEETKCIFRALSITIPDKLISPKWVNETAVACVSPGGWGSGTKS